MSTATHNEALFDAHWLRLVNPGPIEDEPEVKKARLYADVVEAFEDVEYDWTFEYAERAYDRIMDARDTLDEKAHEIIKYLGGGAGLFTLAALMRMDPANRHLLAWALPSFGATLVSLGFAITVRKPNETAFPPTVAAAKRFADYFKRSREAQAAFLGQWHLAFIALSAANDRTARRVQVAIWWLYLAVIGLAFPVLAAIFGGK